jgi:hypothetical protein
MGVAGSPGWPTRPGITLTRWQLNPVAQLVEITIVKGYGEP